MSATTEAEIRAAIERRMSERIGALDGCTDGHGELRCLIDRVAEPLTYPALLILTGDYDETYSEEGGDIWRDLRPSEARGLLAIVHEARERAAARVAPIIVEELVAAGVRFAEEHPDAPRARRSRHRRSPTLVVVEGVTTRTRTREATGPGEH